MTQKFKQILYGLGAEHVNVEIGTAAHAEKYAYMSFRLHDISFRIHCKCESTESDVKLLIKSQLENEMKSQTMIYVRFLEKHDAIMKVLKLKKERMLFKFLSKK